MGNVKEILRRTPPPILYHYTTQQGLLGIIRDKEIWASHTQYLNDVREFRHALDLVKEELSAMKSEAATNELSHKTLAAMEESVLSGLESINVCVCSFSEQGDLRDPAQMARIYENKLLEISGNEHDQATAAREVVDLCGHIAKLEKDITRMDVVPDTVTQKLGSLKSQLGDVREIEVRHTRIAKSRRQLLDRWLSEGTPTNRELIERDRTESEALR